MTTRYSASRTWGSLSSSVCTRSLTPSYPRTPGTATMYRSVLPTAESTTSQLTSGWMAMRPWHSGRPQVRPPTTLFHAVNFLTLALLLQIGNFRILSSQSGTRKSRALLSWPASVPIAALGSAWGCTLEQPKCMRPREHCQLMQGVFPDQSSPSCVTLS